MPLPARRLRDAARPQGEGPAADIRGGGARGTGRPPRPRHPVARPLRLPEQDGVRLRREARRARPGAPGEGQRPQETDLPADPAPRRVPHLLPRRRARLPRPRRIRPGPRPRRLRAGDAPGQLRHLVLREAKRTGELMAVLVTAPLPDLDLAPLAGRLRDAAPELRSFVHVVNSRGLRLRRARERPARRRGPVHRGGAGRADLPDLPADLLPDQHGRRRAPLPRDPGEGPARTGQPRPRALLRQRRDRALARGLGRPGDGGRRLAGQHRHGRRERPRQPDRERRLCAGDGRGPGRPVPPRAGGRRRRRPAPRRTDQQGAQADAPRRRAGPRLRVLQSGIARPRSPGLPRRRATGSRPSRRFDLFPHTPHLETPGRARPLERGAFTFGRVHSKTLPEEGNDPCPIPSPPRRSRPLPAVAPAGLTPALPILP
ncbi:MAG: hypothetical protein MZV64_43580 [Ignavibacteriales bacterium]|nr:hypothetical protein [Ignavibacteriales bacterium]